MIDFFDFARKFFYILSAEGALDLEFRECMGSKTQIESSCSLYVATNPYKDK